MGCTAALPIDLLGCLDDWLERDRLEGKWLNCPHSHCWNANSPRKLPSEGNKRNQVLIYCSDVEFRIGHFCIRMSDFCLWHYLCRWINKNCQRTTAIYLPWVTEIDGWRVMTYVEKTWDERVKCRGICILSDFDVHLRRLIHCHQS